jgi:urease accessory protein
MQLTSAALPIGAFAYSQGLESAVERGEIRDSAGVWQWMTGLLEHSLMTSDVPVLLRLHSAWAADDARAIRRWNDFLFACRGSAELRAEDRQVGAALARLLDRLDLGEARAWIADDRATLATPFALASVRWQITAPASALGYAFAWAQSQVGAATRLLPIGQSDAQIVLSSLLARIETKLGESLTLSDNQLGSSTPGQLLLSALHETQYSRLFRS